VLPLVFVVPPDAVPPAPGPPPLPLAPAFAVIETEGAADVTVVGAPIE
jgi:hypothetical protein